MGFSHYARLIVSNRNYRALFSATAISLIGDWFNVIAVVTLLSEIHHAGAASIATVLIIKQLPMLLLSPFAGVLADRMSRQHLMIASDIARAVVVLGFLLAPIFPYVWFVYLLLTLQASFAAFFEPSRSATTPDVVAPQDLGAANAVGAMLWSTMLIVGSALGGSATEMFGWEYAMLLDSLSFVFSAYLLSKMSYVQSHLTKPSETKEKISFVRELKFLFRYFSERPQVLALAAIKGLYGIGGAMYLLLTLFGQRIFVVGASGALGISTLYIARGAGALCGPFLGRAILKDSKPAARKAIFFALIGISLSYMLLSQCNDIWSAVVCVYFGHMAGSIIWVFSTILIQQETSNEIRGRVFGFDLGAFTLTSTLSTWIYGNLIDSEVLSVSGATLIMGSLWLIPAALWFWAQRFWDQEKQKPLYA